MALPRRVFFEHVFVRNGMTGNGEWAGISTTGLGRSPARESESPALSAQAC